MATIKVVGSADFSNAGMGRVDKYNIDRRAIIGGLERNYLDLQLNKVFSKQVVDLSISDSYKIRYCFPNLAGNNAIYHPCFSVCDYVNKRAFLLQQKHGADGALDFYVSMQSLKTANPFEYTSKQDRVACGITPYSNDIFHVLEIEIDFMSCSIVSAKLNDVSKTIIPGTSSIGNTLFVDGADITVSFGSDAKQLSQGQIGYAKPSFAQLLTNNEMMLLNFDFLGDTMMQILSDKTGRVHLRNADNKVVTVVSKPMQ